MTAISTFSVRPEMEDTSNKLLLGWGEGKSKIKQTKMRNDECLK
jgi:hypothetical protein